MNEPAPALDKKPTRFRWLGAALFLLALFMYVSIMIKIIKFGP